MRNCSPKMNEFVNKVSQLCWEYNFEIWPTKEWNKRNEDGTYPTFTIHNMSDDEKLSLIYLDGDGDPED